MSTMIICVGKPMLPGSGSCDSAGFDAAVLETMSTPCPPYEGKRYNPQGKTVLIGEGVPALDTAQKMLLPCRWIVDPLLNEIPLRSSIDTQRSFSHGQWLRKAAAQRKRGDTRQPEAAADVRARADRLIEKISGDEHIIISYPVFMSVLLKRLRAQGYVVRRTGYLRIQPYERFLVSKKDEHCGGCRHNCLLKNPGCGVGQDKAKRKGINFPR